MDNKSGLTDIFLTFPYWSWCSRRVGCRKESFCSQPVQT